MLYKVVGEMDYVGDLYAYYPRIEAPWRAGAFVAGAIMVLVTSWLCRQKRIRMSQAVADTILVVYVFLMLASTVFSRSPGEEYSYELEVFWTYRKLFSEGGVDYQKEIVYNIVMLVPVGGLLPVALGKNGWFPAVFAGFFCSAAIEILQLVLKRGLFEFDDLLHNTAGAAAGYGLYLLVKWQKNKMCKKDCRRKGRKCQN